MDGPPIYQVDAFADAPFAGNPAAVVVLDGPADATWMQSLGAEMNLSETAFVHPEGSGWALRWFTPAVEVALCGHATLASAHALWEGGHVPAGRPIAFTTLSGVLTATADGEWIALDFPAVPPREAPAPAGLREALGVDAVWTGAAAPNVLVEVATPAAVAAAAPDFAALLAATTASGVQGVILMAAGGERGADVTSRYFAPYAGIDEDPVTGSAHCALGPLWAGRLGREDLVCHQASARGGIVRVGVRGDRVRLGGRAVTVLAGRLAV
ncbi:MAG: PhzF family phenazine biosynthesis protein [Thermoleophilia bacterium]